MTGVTRLCREARTTGRPAAPVRIVHLGVGAFHRAHQAWYTARARDAASWGIAAFTGRSDDVVRELGPQDGLFTLVERASDADRMEVVDSIVEVRPATDTERLIELLADPQVAVVTLTVTEAGYHLDTAGELDLGHPDVAADLRALVEGTRRLRTPVGRLTAGLDARRRAGSGPLAVVPCDNIPDNGGRLRRAVETLAHRAGLAGAADLASFVSTSVDRITPRTTADDVRAVEALTGWRDDACVVTEPFSDWTLSGDFPAGRPDWAARFVDDVAPYERRKLLVLNGGHLSLAFSGMRRGHATVAEAVGDPVCRSLLLDFWDEAARAVDARIDTAEYREALLGRFENPRIEHRLAQIAVDTATKLRLRVVPVLESERRAGRGGAASAAVLKDWLALVAGDLLPASAADIDELSALVATNTPTTRPAESVAPQR